jgi:hypothetical protein
VNSALSAIAATLPSRSHEMSASTLDDNSRLMIFNWLVATYAHRDWLGSWVRLLEPREGVAMRVLRRASSALLECHALSGRYLKQADEHGWLLLPPRSLEPVAQALGVAMLGGWVRNGLEREQVLQQLRVLGPGQRAAAMNHAESLRALPFSTSRGGWPMARMEPSSVFELGLSCLAALLTDQGAGSRERFLMRFPKGMVAPLELNQAQREEALSLIHGLTRAHGVTL